MQASKGTVPNGEGPILASIDSPTRHVSVHRESQDLFLFEREGRDLAGAECFYLRVIWRVRHNPDQLLGLVGHLFYRFRG
jgi:hypothetical protein